MFSPSQNGAAPPASVRTSRRRQRPSSNDGSIAEPKPKRQRSALSDQTFLPPGDALEMEETKKFRTAALTRNESVREVLAPPREMVVRGKKSRSADRGNKGDGSTLLVGLNPGVLTTATYFWGLADYERYLHRQQASRASRSSSCRCRSPSTWSSLF